jgi:hypothetical protein
MKSITSLRIIKYTFPAIASFALLGALLAGCASPATSTTTSGRKATFQTASNQSVSYSTNPQDVLVRTFYGGGLQGTLELAPQVSIYGDGTYILNLGREGKLDSAALQQLLSTLVDKDGLLNFARRQFADIPDQDATFLELSLDGKQEELMYGSFGNIQENAQDMDAYHRLGQALSAITAALKGPMQPYRSTATALLVRQMFSPDLSRAIPTWSLSDFTLAQAAVYECGVIPPDEVGLNPETACLKYTIPQHAILLTQAQVHSIQAQLQGSQGTFTEGGLYYTVTLRPLLPDELATKTLAMFGSAQEGYIGVPLLVGGKVPPAPTATPSS